ncbi:MAG TPA: amidase [Candidatus Binataceae bacterium]|nr:amidase [Candidatus Binataceae bacterium]
MSVKPPTAEEIRELARESHFELSASELDALVQAVRAQIPLFERVDAFTLDISPSAARYPNRDAGAPMNRTDDPLNAVVRKCHVAGAPSGKLKGKRVGLKDSICVAGIPASGGSHVLQGYTADTDATIVTRMLDAGAEIVAMLNMDDLALSGNGKTCACGPTLNPVNPEFCSGGSSSGSAAALGYDWIDITIGTDQGGSIRIPSSWSGVVGIKPTYSLVPYTGVMSIDPSLDHVGPMAKNVRDCALMLEVLAGKDPLDQRQQNVPAELYAELLDRGVKGLRLGILREGFAHSGAEADVNECVRNAGAALEKLGATVQELSIPEHRDASELLFAIAPEGMMWLADTALQSVHFNGSYNPSLADFFSAHLPSRASKEALTVKLMFVLGRFAARRYNGRLYARAQNYRPKLRARYDDALKRCDALLMPTTPMKAPRQDSEAPYSMITNTAPFNITGHPGLSIPCAMSKGLPVGLMLIGRHFEDATLLRIGQAYEQSIDWRKA